MDSASVNLRDSRDFFLRRSLPVLAAALLMAACVGAGEDVAGAATGASGNAEPGLDPREAARRIDAMIDQLMDRSPPAPGLAVAIVSDGSPDLIRVEGVVNTETGAPADANSAFYIASMTKAYMGLLAVQLDAQGVLDLDVTLGEQWPDLRLPGGADAGELTLRDLLTHQIPLRNGPITTRAAYMDEVPAAQYERLLQTTSTPRPPGFAYANLGYNIYGAILEQRTGKPWKQWLQEALFSPLGMTRTSANTSDIPADELSWRHEQTPQGWVALPPKTDAIMQSAGGLVTSANDLAAWMIANLQRSAAGLAPEVFDEAQRRQVGYDLDNGCDGYAFGWNTCTWFGVAVLAHGGGYTGMRSYLAIAPERGAGIAVAANSDRMTGFLTRRLSELYVAYLTDAGEGDTIATTLVSDYHGEVRLYEQGLARREAERRNRAQWGGWGWAPGSPELAAYAGRYQSTTWPDAVVTVEGNRLRLAAGAYALVFEPAQPDLFGGKISPHSDYDALAFRRNPGGDVVGLRWDSRDYTRAGSGSEEQNAPPAPPF